MSRARITSKGQTTIPQEIREFLNIHPGDSIDFIVLDNGTVEVRPAYIDVRDLSGILKKEVGNKIVSVEEMNRSIKERVARQR
jgi:AbrB family looped-hinge helix DNA binding protein